MIILKILKFGGTALATKGSRTKVIELIKNENVEKLIVVVSAMGRGGFPYATDTLLSLIKDCQVSLQEKDRLISVGEIISSIILCNELKQNNVNSYALSVNEMGIIIDNQDQIEINIQKISSLLEKYNVLIVPGFIALNEEREICTLSRGGSDLTAIELAKALNIDEVTLYKDVDGVYPTYPLLNKEIKPYHHLSYDEMLLLESIGYKIVNKEAIINAKEFNKRIIITNYITNKKGTEIGLNSCDNQYIGVISTHNTIVIVLYDEEKGLEVIKNILKEVHIFIKEFYIQKHCVLLKISNSQISNAKKEILKHLFLCL